MDDTIRPHFRKLTREEIHEFLARNNVGRIAYAKANKIDIEPIHYVYSEGWIYGRTAPGTHLRTNADGWWHVAFEVDEVRSIFEWKSVVVHGGFYTLSESGAEWERKEYRRAVAVIRTLLPAAFTDHDPTPLRTAVFRIAVQEVSGREATLTPAHPRPVEGALPGGAD